VAREVDECACLNNRVMYYITKLFFNQLLQHSVH